MSPDTDIIGTITLPQLAAVALADDRADRAAAAERERIGFDALRYEGACFTARSILGHEAGELLDGDWKVIRPNVTEEMGGAVAVVAADPASVLLRYTPPSNGMPHCIGTLDLVRTCGHCGGERVYPVDSLSRLGELLAADPTPEPEG